MYKILLPLASLAAGATIGSILTVNASLDIAKYLSIAILAALDSVLGGARALLEDTYDSLIMLSGFSDLSALSVLSDLSASSAAALLWLIMALTLTGVWSISGSGWGASFGSSGSRAALSITRS